MPRGFGFVHHSRTVFCRAVPNPNTTIRNFFVAVPRPRATRAVVGGEQVREGPQQQRAHGGRQGRVEHERAQLDCTEAPPPDSSPVRSVASMQRCPYPLMRRGYTAGVRIICLDLESRS